MLILNTTTLHLERSLQLMFGVDWFLHADLLAGHQRHHLMLQSSCSQAVKGCLLAAIMIVMIAVLQSMTERAPCVVL